MIKLLEALDACEFCKHTASERLYGRIENEIAFELIKNHNCNVSHALQKYCPTEIF